MIARSLRPFMDVKTGRARSLRQKSLAAPTPPEEDAFMMTEREESEQTNREIEFDLARIRRRWARYKRAVPDADWFSFLASIAATDMLPAVPERKNVA